jgi:molecular chaperone HtpG
MGQFIPPDLLEKFSAVEYFLLMASAMLHDFGMVVTEEELRVVNRRKDFVDFRSRFLHEFREPSDGMDLKLRAAVLDRLVVAEYYRALHHKRSAQFIFSYFADFLAPFGPPNSRLVKTLAIICERHGLAREELENKARFPLNMDLDGESANVCLLAAIVRIADLLDMDSVRACPLILRLVSPVPPGSIEHWTKHNLDSLSVSPTEIRIGRTCQNPDEQCALLPVGVLARCRSSSCYSHSCPRYSNAAHITYPNRSNLE